MGCSLFSVLWVEALTTLSSGISFRGCLYREYAWKVKTPSEAKGKFAYSFGSKRWCLPFKQRPGIHTACFKILGFLRLRVPLALNTTHLVNKINITPCELEAEGTHKYADVHAVFCAVCNQVLDLWPNRLMSSASIHNMVVSWLAACKQAKVSNSLQFLTKPWVLQTDLDSDPVFTVYLCDLGYVCSLSLCFIWELRRVITYLTEFLIEPNEGLHIKYLEVLGIL